MLNREPGILVTGSDLFAGGHYHFLLDFFTGSNHRRIGFAMLKIPASLFVTIPDLELIAAKAGSRL